MTTETDDHWSIQGELERKAVEAMGRIGYRLSENLITHVEAGIAYEMVYWMIAGLSGDVEMEAVLSATATKLNNMAKLTLLTKGSTTVAAMGAGDHYELFTVTPKASGTAPAHHTKNGHGYLCETLIAKGFEKVL